jgi:hypothetical protein
MTDIVFEGSPGPEAPRFVEVEDPPGRSISFGEWVKRDDGYWVLRFTVPEDQRQQLTDARDYADELKDALRDLVMLKAQDDIGCVPPPTREQWKKAWRAAEEFFEP